MKPKVIVCMMYFNSRHLGQLIQQVQVPYPGYLLGIVRQGTLILAERNPVLQEQDWLIAIILDPSQSPRVETYLKQLQPFIGHHTSHTIVLS